MPWYRSGTVAITAGQTSVVGTNTDFAANARVGDAFQGPDGRWYEVANIASATVLSILPAYQGATISAGGYGLAPMQGYVKESADRLRQIVDQFGGTLALFGGATDVATLRLNIGAAARGDNSDITRLSGLTTALSVAQGGTGGKTQAEARVGLGLKAAAVADIVGTVSQSGGLPTGAIVEMASNANGTAVKFAGGHMVCTRRIPLVNFASTGATTLNDFGGYRSSENSVQFAANFIEAPVTSVAMTNNSGGVSARVYSSSGSQCLVTFHSVSSGTPSSTGVTVEITAVGRWHL